MERNRTRRFYSARGGPITQGDILELSRGRASPKSLALPIAFLAMFVCVSRAAVGQGAEFRVQTQLTRPERASTGAAEKSGQAAQSATSPSAQANTPQTRTGELVLGQGRVFVAGTITSSAVRLPGVVIKAVDLETCQARSTVSDDQGRYQLVLPGPGMYRLETQLFGFSSGTRILRITKRKSEADFTLSLAGAEDAQALSAPLHDARRTARATREQADAKPLSAEMPMDFSFVTGHVAQPVDPLDTPGGKPPSAASNLHGNVFYQAGTSALDASPYALHNIVIPKPEYQQSSFGAHAGGVIPWLKNGTTSLFASYSGYRSATPYSGFATVPTAALRAGDFSRFSGTIYDPATGQPFPQNRIPAARFDPTALAILHYIPLPNGEGMSQNFRFLTATHARSDAFTLSLSHGRPTLTKSSTGVPIRNSFAGHLAFNRANSDQPNVFPLLGGNSTNRAWSAGFSYTIAKSFFTNEARVNFSGIRSRAFNRFHQDVAAALGVNGVSRDSFDWGLPAVAFTQFTGIADSVPALRGERNLAFSDALNWTHSKHNLKWGGEFHRLSSDLRRNEDAAGSFLFSGFATSGYVNSSPVLGTGSDFADFLLGVPQKTHLQYSDGPFSFRGVAWNLFFVDDWRVANNLTLNVGIRYEYVSPLSEGRNRLATLDAPADFSAVALVLAGGVGPFTGRFRNTIAAPDRNNLAPRIGVAWRAAENVVVRGGYSINYDTSVYNSLATQLALQPPFAVGQTNIAGHSQTLTLQNGFPPVPPATVSNNFAAPHNLPTGFAQVWVLQLQNELPRGFVVVSSYTGTKGSHLPLLRAPNRTASGLSLPDVAPFLWQTASGSSILHAGSVGLQKRLAQGLTFNASYMFSRSIDNVPGLGDETQVAQDDRALYHERGLSAFDQRHRVNFDYRYELPFGRGKQWLRESRLGNGMLGDWSVSGTIHYASGMPLTPHVVGDLSDVAAGGYGALRPDVTGEPIQLPQPTVDRFFNTGAFVPPPIGSYGNAPRNTIIGAGGFTMDAAVDKSLAVGERHMLQFQTQITNLLNHPQFTEVDTNLKSASYGQITDAGKMRSVQLSLRYLF